MPTVEVSHFHSITILKEVSFIFRFLSGLSFDLLRCKIPAWDHDGFVLRIWNHCRMMWLNQEVGYTLTVYFHSVLKCIQFSLIIIVSYNSFHVLTVFGFVLDFWVMENFNMQINPVFKFVTCNHWSYAGEGVHTTIAVCLNQGEEFLVTDLNGSPGATKNGS